MSSFVFVLPVESGEKMSFSITILLAEIVSFGSISDTLPASSLSFPSIGYFVYAAVIQTALSSLLAMTGKYNIEDSFRSPQPTHLPGSFPFVLLSLSALREKVCFLLKIHFFTYGNVVEFN